MIVFEWWEKKMVEGHRRWGLGCVVGGLDEFMMSRRCHGYVMMKKGIYILTN